MTVTGHGSQHSGGRHSSKQIYDFGANLVYTMSSRTSKTIETLSQKNQLMIMIIY